jgi:glycerol-3-phosphate dehydrogenase (NAD(P)+)
MKAGVVGGGSWGSAFALHLGRIGIPTRLWIREAEIHAAAVRERENKVFLPGFKFPPEVTFHRNLAESVAGADLVFIAVPSAYFRKVLVRMAPAIGSGQGVISLTKGLEKTSLLRMSEVKAEILAPSGLRPLGVLSGPSFSKEVARGFPTAVVLASRDSAWARGVQARIAGPALRIYASKDVAGVEISGALKNVIAIAAGISDALGFGHNARAALITRGLAETARLGAALGAKRETFSGLAGIGDLVLTCTGALSRNRSVGVELGRGRSLAAITADMRMVAEGIATTLSARRLARREGVEMPIAEQIYQILYHGKDPRRALADLMARSPKDE